MQLSDTGNLTETVLMSFYPVRNRRFVSGKDNDTILSAISIVEYRPLVHMDSG